MAKCAVCEKGVHYGNNVSHSHRRSNRVWKSNIKRVSCKVNGVPLVKLRELSKLFKNHRDAVVLFLCH